jgi:hypothetical protein
MNKIILIGLLLISTPVIACDSYENCMDYCGENEGDLINGEIIYKTPSNCQKAIAFKLDEISKNQRNTEALLFLLSTKEKTD